MKTIVLFFATMTMSMLTFGQTYDPFLINETEITPPKFNMDKILVHGQTSVSIVEYLAKHIPYPAETDRQLSVGTEVIQFKVSSTGELIDFQVINSISTRIDDDVIRVLRTTSGKWMPGSINGENVAMSQEVSLVFKPNDTYDLTGTAKIYQDKGNEKLFVKKDPRCALKFYNRAIKLLPYEESILAARCFCKNELGDEKGAIQDMERILALYPNSDSDIKTGSLDALFSKLKSDAELTYFSK